MSQSVAWVQRSSNAKTGPIPVTYSSRTTCPTTCPLVGKCYGEDFFTARVWNRVDKGEGVDWSTLCANVKALPSNQAWRMNVTGDLPRNDDGVDVAKLRQLTKANEGKRGYTYTHNADAQSLAAVKEANEGGFTINLSANSLSHADELANANVGPVVTLLPIDAPAQTHTPQGKRVIVCPAQTRDDVTCATCLLCARRDRKVIIGFRAHGSRAKVVNIVAQG